MVLVLCFISLPCFGQCGSGPCEVCNVTATVTSIQGGTIVNSTSTILDNTQAGATGVGETELVVSANACGEIQISVELNFDWDKGLSSNWIHGISFFTSSGWSAAQGTIIPPNDGWIFLNGITGVCSGNTYGAGYYWDPVGTACTNSGNRSSFDGVSCAGSGGGCEADDFYLTDGDPSDNFGIDCETNCPGFGFNLSYCPSFGGDVTEIIEFFLTEDGETGGWRNSDGCVFSLQFPIKILSAGSQLQDDVTICEGDCITLDAGAGCDDYNWSNSETTQEITVCPTATTTYSIALGVSGNCNIQDSVQVTVTRCCDANAGTFSTLDVPECRGGNLMWEGIGYQMNSAYQQHYFITDSNGDIISTSTNQNGSLEIPACGSYTIYAYNFFVEATSIYPLVGTNVSLIECAINCCALEAFAFTVESLSSPAFDLVPADVTIECLELLDQNLNIGWTDDCLGFGESTADEVRNLDSCSGGTILRTWIAEDDCMNAVSYMQTITVEAARPPVFESLPQNFTVDCSLASSQNAIDISYSTSGPNVCQLEGEVMPQITNDYDICGGTIKYDWSFTDACNNSISHSQIISVNAAPTSKFIELPNDTTLACNDPYFNSLPALTYDNGELTNCEISGLVDPAMTGSIGPCGEEVLIDWEFEDVCGRKINHQQRITVRPSAIMEFINPPQDITVDCENIPQGGIPNLNYSNHESGVCLIEGNIIGVQSGTSNECGGTITRVWEFEDECGRRIEHIQSISIRPSSSTQILNSPVDITVGCDDIPKEGPPNLMYSNAASGICLIEGSIEGTESGTADECGGMITRVWEFTDACGRYVSHSQTITVEPTEMAQFENKPADVTMNYNMYLDFEAENLIYTNHQNSSCLIDGSVTPEENADLGEEGGTSTFRWEFTDDCGRVISYDQHVTIVPVISEVYIPNVFSPNSDNNGNDHFTLYANEGVEMIEELYVFNRWGERVFYAQEIPVNDPMYGWDGSYKSKAAPIGIYVYLFNVRNTNQQIDQYTGNVMIVR